MPSLLFLRDISGDVKSNLPSTWDKCMAKTYCKWPVIVAIIVVALIVLSLVFCIARCLCCGAEVACCCFKCCTCCCPSGGGRRNKNGHKRMDSGPPPQQGYPSAYQQQPTYGPPPVNTQYRSPAPPVYERPQFATFESPSKPVNEDALPAMPSWQEAKSHKVEETVIPEKPDDVEMDRLNHGGAGSPLSAGAAAVPLRSPARSPVPRAPSRENYSTSTNPRLDTYAGAGPRRSPQGPPSPYDARPQYGGHEEGYRGISPHPASPTYAVGGAYGRASPRPIPNRQNSRPNPGPPSPPYGTGVQDYALRNPNQPTYEMPSPGFHQDQAFAAASVGRSNSPGYAHSGYAPSGSTKYEPSTVTTAAYPGQQAYQPTAQEKPAYQAYRPQAQEPASPSLQSPTSLNFSRKPVNGSWKEV